MTWEKAIPLLIGTCPLLIFHLTHYLSASQGYVPWCVPYWEGCTSISATGRQGSAFVVFKITMLPVAVLLWLYWRGAWNRLCRTTGWTAPRPWFMQLGLPATVFLMVYTIALGISGDVFQLTRRIGITGYFGLTFLSQLMFTRELVRLGLGGRPRHGLTAICLVILLTALVSFYLDLRLENYADYEDSFEWSVTLMLQMFFLLSWWVWRDMDRDPRSPR